MTDVTRQLEVAAGVDPLHRAGPLDGVDPAVHLRRMLRRRALLGDAAVRLPAWLLFDDGERLGRRIGW